MPRPSAAVIIFICPVEYSVNISRNNVPEITTEANAAAFTKAQLVASQRYVHRRDLIGALLEDGKTYTLNEVDALIEKFMKGKVR